MVAVPSIKLIHGAEIPAVGLGSYALNDPREIVSAIDAGYRLIDTAENYGNEVAVGQAVARCGVPREELFITTKFNKEWHSVEGAAKAWANSCERMGLDYIDLLLIHWPNPQQDSYVEAWQGLVKLLDQGKVRAIGTSNFKPKHLQRIIDATGVVPDVNQIELNPYHGRFEAVEFHRSHGIRTESWSPLKPTEVLSDPVIINIANNHGITPSQAILRWHVQRGLLPIPKSANPVRQAENLNIFNFELSQEEMAGISALDLGESAATDSDVTGH